MNMNSTPKIAAIAKYAISFLVIACIIPISYAATYYVSSAGNDANDGSQAHPWLTMQHAVDNIHCGDTINVVANGSYVASGDAYLPLLPGCTLVNTIQSTNLAQLNPVGWRTNPANDSANYGKLKISNQGLSTSPKVYSWNPYFGVTSVSFSGAAITITGGNGLTFGMANGHQIVFDKNDGHAPAETNFPFVDLPAPLTYGTKYYVVNCSGCGAQNTTFGVSATPGGAAITVTGCTNGTYCEQTVGVSPTPGAACTTGTIEYNPNDSSNWECIHSKWDACTSGCSQFTNGSFHVVELTVDVSASTSTFTIVQNWSYGSLSNGDVLGFSAQGFQNIGTLPAPLQQDVNYYAVNVSGSSFQVAASPGGSPITITNVGTGALNMSTAVANNWAARGLELQTSANVGALIALGTGREASSLLMPKNFEIDRCYLHDDPGGGTSFAHGIFDNGQFVSIHDNWIIGGALNEPQALNGTSSMGPTWISNNFMEAAGEVVLYGGDMPAYPAANAFKTFRGNYFYKPPIWKQTSASGVPSGTCWYDATDPTHAGGEYYRDTGGAQTYQCQPNHTWATVAGGLPVPNLVKVMTEHKNGRWFAYIGNFYQYNWVYAQSGQEWNTNNEPNNGSGASNDNITKMFNKAQHVYTVDVIGSRCFNAQIPCPNPNTTFTAINNVTALDGEACGIVKASGTQVGCGALALGITYGAPTRAGATQVGLLNGYWNKNTVYAPDSTQVTNIQVPAAFWQNISAGSGDAGTTAMQLWTFKNSIWAYDVGGDGSCGGTTFSGSFMNTTWSRMAQMMGGTCSYASPGTGNVVNNQSFPANNAAIKWVNESTLDLHLASNSPYSAQNGTPTLLSDDGTDLGADIDMVNMMTSGAAAGTPNWHQLAAPQVQLGSDGVVFRYNNPAISGVCTVTVYNSVVRIAANIVTSKADSDSSAVSDGPSRQVPITGLTASTRYPVYTIACPNGVLIVGDSFTTQAIGSGTTFPFQFSGAVTMKTCTNAAMNAGCSTTGSAASQAISVTSQTTKYTAQLDANSNPQGVTILRAP